MALEGSPQGATHQGAAHHGGGAAEQQRERVLGLSILGAAFVVSLLFSWWVTSRVHADPAGVGAGSPDTSGLVGFPDRFEPLGALGRVRTATARWDLFGVALTGVRSDGTLDLDRGGKARFVMGNRRGDGFQAPIPRGERRWRDHCGRQEVLIDRQGLRAGVDEPEHDCGGMKAHLPDPSCSLQQIWQNATQKGVPASALADIEYFKAKAGPAFRFRVPGAAEYVWYGDCTQQLEGAQASGEIP